MARPSFRATLVGAVLTLFALGAAIQLSGCTPTAGRPQAIQPPISAAQTPVVTTAPPIPLGAPAPAPTESITDGHAKVALLVPLTGPNKPIGQAMLDAANLALFDVPGNLALMPRDTGGSPESARAAAEKAVADGAGLILGPIFSAAVSPVRSAIATGQMSIIAYTTDADAAGGDVFVMGFLPAQQISRVVAFAKSRGMTKLAVLAPDNAYGVAVKNEIAAIQDTLGLQPPRILTLDRDPGAQIASLGDDPPDALLIALGGDQLQSLAPAIQAYAAAHPVQLLGTGLWADDPALANLPALAGGWYAAPTPTAFASFASRFQRTYNYRPPRIASLAYDSVALAATVATGAASDAFSRDRLLQPNGFVGIDGGFRFLPSGLSERNLAILAVGPDGPAVIDPPAPTFEPLSE